jgi:hypothetical protein
MGLRINALAVSVVGVWLLNSFFNILMRLDRGRSFVRPAVAETSLLEPLLPFRQTIGADPPMAVRLSGFGEQGGVSHAPGHGLGSGAGLGAFPDGAAVLSAVGPGSPDRRHRNDVGGADRRSAARSGPGLFFSLDVRFPHPGRRGWTLVKPGVGADRLILATMNLSWIAAWRPGCA